MFSALRQYLLPTFSILYLSVRFFLTLVTLDEFLTRFLARVIVLCLVQTNLAGFPTMETCQV